jgi:prophage antirepressor-like protein
MDILKAFSLYDKEYNINIQGSIDKPLFQANQIGKLLEIAKIRNHMLNFNENDKVAQESSTPGGMQKVLFLTESGLYKILSRSNKPIAKVFQDWMVKVIKELRKTGEYKLKEEHEIEKKLIKANEHIIAKKNTHETLMEFCKMKNVVYVCKLRDESDDKFIIKIGSTQNIKERFARINYNYKMTPLLLNIFDCENHTQFEKWIRNNELLKPLYFKITKNDGTEARETFLVNEEQYNNIIKLMREQVKQFTREDVDKLLELEKMKQITEEKININEEKRNINEEKRIKAAEIEKKTEEIRKSNFELEIKLEELKTLNEREKKLENTIKLQEDNIVNEETEKEKEEVNIPDDIYVKTRENTRSPKVYQYDPNTLELIQIYDSVITFTRHFHSSSGSALREAAKNNRIYKDFRWALSERNVAEAPILEPTVESRTQSVEYIAMIDIKKTKILDVYPSQKEAAMSRNLAGFSTISRAIKKNGISSGHYWNVFHKCSQEMKDEYLKHNKLPEQHIKANGVKVLQINPITNEEIKQFDSITEVIKKFQMARGSLTKASDNDEIHKSFKWKIIKN